MKKEYTTYKLFLNFACKLLVNFLLVNFSWKSCSSSMLYNEDQNLVLSKSKSTVELIPNEILLKILANLSYIDLGKATCVNTRWQSCIDSSNLWKEAFDNLSLYLDRVEKRCSLNFKKVISENHLKLLSFIDGMQGKNIGKLYPLNFHPNVSSEILLKFQMLRNVSNDEAQALIDKFIEIGDKVLVNFKISSLKEGKNGYKKDLNTAVKFVNDLCIKGNETALLYKIENFIDNMCEQENSSFTLINLIEELLTKNNKNAFIYKIEGLENGIYGYNKNSTLAQITIENFINKSSFFQTATYYKLMGFHQGKYGYEKDLEKAYKFNEHCIMRGDIKAINRKIQGLIEGKYGYKHDLVKARSYIEEVLVMYPDNEKAFSCKLWGHISGIYGYKKNIEEAYKFIEDGISKNNFLHTLKKYTELCGINSYPKLYDENLILAQKLIEKSILHQNSYALSLKITSMLNGCSKIFEKNIKDAHVLIDEQVLKNNRQFMLVKLAGLSYGIFGYKQNEQAAINFSKTYYIHPYMM